MTCLEPGRSHFCATNAREEPKMHTDRFEPDQPRAANAMSEHGWARFAIQAVSPQWAYSSVHLILSDDIRHPRVSVFSTDV